MRRALILLSALAVAALAGVVLHVVRTPSAQGDPGLLQLNSNVTTAEAQAYSGYPLYYAGNTFAGLALTSIHKEAISAPPEGLTPWTSKLAQASNPDVSSFDFTYGSCPAPDPNSDDFSCSIPVVVQMWPACIRNPSLYQNPPMVTGADGQDHPLPVPAPEPTTVRGVPAAYFEDGVRLEIQAGISTIVIFDHRAPANTMQVADALTRLNGPVPDAGQPLPTPPAAALNGTLGC